jgi:RNA polymerase sigma factor (sigma-70 family)
VGAAPGYDRESAWRTFVRRYGRFLANTVRRTLRERGEPGGRETVEELRQEVYCRLLAHEGHSLRNFRGSRGQGDDEASVRAYLGAIARSVVLDELRRRHALKRGGGQRRPLSTTGFDNTLDSEQAAPCPERRAILRDRLRALINACTPDKRSQRSVQVLRWAFLEGWTSREIAAALPGRPSPSSIDSMLYRLRRRLTEAAAWA